MQQKINIPAYIEVQEDEFCRACACWPLNSIGFQPWWREHGSWRTKRASGPSLKPIWLSFFRPAKEPTHLRTNWPD